MSAAERVLGYLRKTATDGIIFGNDDKLTSCGYGTSDASHAIAQEVANWHLALGVTGYHFQFFGGPVTWRSSTQRLTSHSPTESELYALDEATSIQPAHQTHPAIRYMYVNQIQEQGEVLIKLLSTDSIPSGALTKPLHGAPFKLHTDVAHGQIATSVDFKGKGGGGLQGGRVLRHSHLDAAPRHCS
jgi:hypothetical protein